MRNVGFVLRRELAAYFATPLAYIFIVIFLVLAGTLTFFVGGFLERGQA
ncbi:MAG: ABC transporter permease, partial [Pseudomonadota bacterium]|nr:ABC transporter permease [Pseudomonadota bacterium]